MNVRARLVLSSGLMLFIELALIRWLSANVVHLGYFSNFVLLGSFLGVGLGFLRWNPNRGKPYYFPIALALLVAFVGIFPVEVDRGGSDVIFFTALTTSGPPSWLVLPVIFCRGRGDPRGPGRARGRVLQPAPSARGLSVGPDRQPARHLGVHRALVPPRSLDRVGHRRRCPHAGPARPEGARARSRRFGGSDRRVALRVPRARRLLVAVLQGHDEERRRLHPRRRERCSPSGRDAGRRSASRSTPTTSFPTSASATTRSRTCSSSGRARAPTSRSR